jgi:hypothetical protein
MTISKIENVTVSELNLASEDRSRSAGRGHRLLMMVAVFLALCMMAVDFGRLDHAAHLWRTHSCVPRSHSCERPD